MFETPGELYQKWARMLPVLVPPLHMSPMATPLALDVVLQSLREQEKPRADGLLGLLRLKPGRV